MSTNTDTNSKARIPLRSKFSIAVLLTIGFAAIAKDSGLSDLIFPKDYVVSLYDADGQKISTIITDDNPNLYSDSRLREPRDGRGVSTISIHPIITDKFAGSTHNIISEGAESVTVHEIAESNSRPNNLTL